MTVRRLVLGVVVLSLVAAACGGDGEGAGAEGEPRELTAVIPFPSGVAFFPPFVAEARGYFAEEGLSVTVETVDGSGQVLQQLLSGQADIGFPSPGPFMNAVLSGEDLVSVYTLYQQNVFTIVTLEGSDVGSLEDVRGTTIGVGTIEGGETPFVKAVLSESSGLEEGPDYDVLAVGDGGTASVALDRGEISVYAASFADVAIMRLRGVEVRSLLPEGFRNFFDSLLVVQREFMEENPDVIVGLGRGMAKATAWGQENPEGVMEITAQSFPEEAEDPDFTLALLEETLTLYALPAEAEGRWGYAVPEFVERFMNFLVEQGELAEPIDTDVFVNDFVDEYNDFEASDL